MVYNIYLIKDGTIFFLEKKNQLKNILYQKKKSQLVTQLDQLINPLVVC